MIYHSVNAEIDTLDIIKNALTSGKQVYLPTVSGKIMEFYRIHDLDNLVIGKFAGIPEPHKTEKYTGTSALCITPALCHDRHGYRIGYGGGYYDRFLQDFGGTSIGLCRQEYLFDTIEHEQFDTPVDIIVTEKEVIPIEKRV